MRNVLATAALACLLAWQGPAAARDGGPTSADGEMTIGGRLTGSWAVSEIEFQGMKVPLPPGQDIAFTFQGAKLLVNQMMMKQEEGTYKIDDKTSPKQIDLTGSLNQPGTIKGIYHLEGDTLKIAFSMQGPGGQRPTGFDAKDIVVMICKRKK
jgi:uncharacterized protein (TIGR03067 family)